LLEIFWDTDGNPVTDAAVKTIAHETVDRAILEKEVTP